MNRKTGIVILIIVGVLSLGAGAYYMFFMSKTTAHVRLIPKDATFVMKFDNKKLYEKAGMDEGKLKDFFKNLNEKAQEEGVPPAAENLLSKLQEKPFSSGVDIISDFYFFAVGKKDQPYGGVVFAVSNTDDLRKTITSGLDDMEQKYEEQKAEKINLIVVENEEQNTLVIAWDETVGLALADDSRDSDDVVKQAKALFTAEAGASIQSVEGFDKFVAQTKDFSLWLSGDLLDQLEMTELIEEQAGFSLTGASLSMFVEFEKDKISTKGVFHPNKSIKEKQKEMNLTGEGIPSALISKLPKQSYFTIAYSLNPNGIYGLMEKDESFKAMKEEFENQAPVSVKDFFDKMGGNMILSIYDFKPYPITTKEPNISFNESTGEMEWNYEEKQIEQTLPSFSLLFDTRNESNFFETLMQPFIEPFTEKLQKQDDYYTLDAEGMKFYILSKDNLVAVTNDEAYIKSLAAGKVAENFEQGELAGEMKGMTAYSRFNLDYHAYPEEMREQVEATIGPESTKTFKKVIRHFNSIQSRGHEYEFEMTVGINNNTNDNSLKLLIDEFSELVSEQ